MFDDIFTSFLYCGSIYYNYLLGCVGPSDTEEMSYQSQYTDSDPIVVSQQRLILELYLLLHVVSIDEPHTNHAVAEILGRGG